MFHLYSSGVDCYDVIFLSFCSLFFACSHAVWSTFAYAHTNTCTYTSDAVLSSEQWKMCELMCVVWDSQKVTCKLNSLERHCFVVETKFARMYVYVCAFSSVLFFFCFCQMVRCMYECERSYVIRTTFRAANFIVLIMISFLLRIACDTNKTETNAHTYINKKKFEVSINYLMHTFERKKRNFDAMNLHDEIKQKNAHTHTYIHASRFYTIDAINTLRYVNSMRHIVLRLFCRSLPNTAYNMWFTYRYVCNIFGALPMWNMLFTLCGTCARDLWDVHCSSV